MWFKGLAAAGFVLAATQVGAQAYHFETSKFTKPLSPNEELHALKGCDSGALVSGGFQILNNASRFAVTKSYPSHFALRFRRLCWQRCSARPARLARRG